MPCSSVTWLSLEWPILVNPRSSRRKSTPSSRLTLFASRPQSLAHSYYVYGFLKSDLYSDYAEGAKSGSVQANMNAKVIVGRESRCSTNPNDRTVPWGSRPRFDDDWSLMSASPESRALAALRDTLLPKLISGEVRVSWSRTVCGGYAVSPRDDVLFFQHALYDDVAESSRTGNVSTSKSIQTKETSLLNTSIDDLCDYFEQRYTD